MSARDPFAGHESAMLEKVRQLALMQEVDDQRTLLFNRLSGHGVRVVPFAGLVFLWQILREVERGGN